MREQLRSIFAQTLQLPEDFDSDELRYRHTLQWDSLGHMSLIVAMEAAFNVEFSPAHVTSIETFAEAEQVLKGLGVNS